MLKYKLETLEGLSDEEKAFYVEKDGAFFANVEGLPEQEDVTGLKNKVDELLKEKRAEAAARREEETKRRDAEEEAARKKGDFEALAKSYEEKIADLQQQLKAKDQEVEQREIQRQATLLSAELAEGHDQEILSTFISQRLKMENGELKVTDEKGNLTISTVDQLKEEFRNSPKFASLIIGSKGSGGGANRASRPTTTGKNFNDMSEGERVELYKSDPDQYRQLRSKSN